MRAFPFRHHGRLLRIVVVEQHDAWQLWVCEEERRLAYGGHVTADEAIAGWRIGEDRVLELAEELKSNVLTDKLGLGGFEARDPTASTAAAPEPQDWRHAHRTDRLDEI